MINIEIPSDYEKEIDTDFVMMAAETTFDHEKVKEMSEITIAFVDPATIQKLNFQFRGIDSPTDVLLFPDEVINPENGNIYLGDVIISYPDAVAQAEANKNSLKYELTLLIVHGILHLLGYDHATHEDQINMWSVQSEILGKMDIRIDLP